MFLLLIVELKWLFAAKIEYIPDIFFFTEKNVHSFPVTIVSINYLS